MPKYLHDKNECISFRAAAISWISKQSVFRTSALIEHMCAKTTGEKARIYVLLRELRDQGSIVSLDKDQFAVEKL
jgi:hypothetical protein